MRGNALSMPGHYRHLTNEGYITNETYSVDLKVTE
jgi:hypothetical protein